MLIGDTVEEQWTFVRHTVFSRDAAITVDGAHRPPVNELLTNGCDPGTVGQYPDMYLLWDLTIAIYLEFDRGFPEIRDRFDPVFEEGHYAVFRINPPQ